MRSRWAVATRRAAVHGDVDGRGEVCGCSEVGSRSETGGLSKAGGRRKAAATRRAARRADSEAFEPPATGSGIPCVELGYVKM